jgi:hypothetical protein
MTLLHRRPARLVASLAFAALCLPGQPALRAQNAAAARPSAADNFDRSEVMIPTRDGVRLHTLIFAPKGQTGDLPIILTRTPYGIAGASRSLGSSYAELAQDGYIFVYQDIRGRYGSDGQFVMLRPMRDKADPKAVDESSDTYDTIEWMLKNVPHNNGRVGMLGVSYPGWLTVMAMLDPHPALKAVSPQASPADMFIGDDFHHNGAFRLSYGFEYAAAMETGKVVTPFKFDSTADLYDWYLNLGSLAHVKDRVLNGQVLPTWNDFASHPNYDAFWQRQGVAKYLDRVNVPTLNVAGWWDQEDFYGPIKIYETLEPHDTKHQNYLVVGPWNHGGWSGGSGQKLGDVDFGSETAKDYRKTILAPWFAYWLKDRGTLNLAEATTFEAGTNQWVKHESWPPKKNVSARRLYTAANGKLSWSRPTDASPTAYDSYVSDPANPVPYRPRPIKPLFSGGNTWSRWLVDDQSFLKGRPDVLTWETPVLTEDVVIAGAIKANLEAATTGSDADWIVKLIDVYPDSAADPKMNGHALMVANDVLRARFRHGYVRPEPITPNKIEPFVVDLHTQDYRFRKGHRIQVQMQSTWFPLIDRNPQTFVPNIFEAKDSDFKAATQRIYRSRGAATYVELPVVTPALVP